MALQDELDKVDFQPGAYNPQKDKKKIKKKKFDKIELGPADRYAEQDTQEDDITASGQGQETIDAPLNDLAEREKNVFEQMKGLTQAGSVSDLIDRGLDLKRQKASPYEERIATEEEMMGSVNINKYLKKGFSPERALQMVSSEVSRRRSRKEFYQNKIKELDADIEGSVNAVRETMNQQMQVLGLELQVIDRQKQEEKDWTNFAFSSAGLASGAAAEGLPDKYKKVYEALVAQGAVGGGGGGGYGGGGYGGGGGGSYYDEDTMALGEDILSGRASLYGKNSDVNYSERGEVASYVQNRLNNMPKGSQRALDQVKSNPSQYGKSRLYKRKARERNDYNEAKENAYGEVGGGIYNKRN